VQIEKEKEKQEKNLTLDMLVALAYNPSYSGSRDQED
jgi:hypothetical protein